MSGPHRKTRRRFENPGQLRFITCSCQHRRPFFNNDCIKQVFVDQLSRTQFALQFELLAWVLMPEHYHLLLLPRLPDHPVSAILKHLNAGVANQVLRRWREMHASVLDTICDARGKYHFWLTGGGYDRNIYTATAAEEKFDYIHNNPIERGLVNITTDWQWSSARWHAGLSDYHPLKISSIEI